MTQSQTAWPARYYEEFDAEKRRWMLEEAIAIGEGDAAENELRRRLWDARYVRPRKNAPLADRYVALWLGLDRWRKLGLAPRQVRAAEKELRETAALLLPEETRTDPGRALLHCELVHAVRLYLKTCTESSYGTTLMGLMRMKSEQLIEKAAAETAEVTVLVPRWAGVEEAFAPLAPAAREAFTLVFPDGGEALERAFARCAQGK